MYKTVDIIEKAAKQNKAEAVKGITLSVGELTGYLPEFFVRYFDIVTEGRELFTDAKLNIEIESGEGVCYDCETMFNVMKNKGKCPACGCPNKHIVSGQQFLIKDVEIAV